MDGAAISVVIPTRDRVELLRQAVASVDAQTLRPHEIVIVDDGSVDGTASWIESLGRADLRFARLPSSRGAGGARNAGIAMARGAIVAMLDDDDAWLPDYLAAVAVEFATARPPAFTYCDGFALGEDGRKATIRHETGHAFPDRVTRWLVAPAPFSSSMFAAERARLLAIGGYDETLTRTQDADLYLRLVLHADAAGAAPPAFIDRALVLHRLHRLGRDGADWARETLASHEQRLDKFFASPESGPYRHLEPEIRSTVRDGVVRFFRRRYGIDLASPAGP